MWQLEHVVAPLLLSMHALYRQLAASLQFEMPLKAHASGLASHEPWLQM